MNRLFGLLVLGALVAPGPFLRGQEAVQDFCVPEECPPVDPLNPAVIDECCIEDTLEIVFSEGDPMTDSIFEYGEFVAGTRIDVVVATNTKADMIQGWSYGVRHDDRFLALDEMSVTTAGTSAAETKVRGFDTTEAVPGGWISAFILSLRLPVHLPVARNTLAKASYTLEADPGPNGALIELVDRVIGPRMSPATDINFTIGGKARFPFQLTQGLVRSTGPAVEICDNLKDDDRDGMVDCDDTDCVGNASCPEICDDGIDNDGDTLTDCDDTADCPAGQGPCPLDREICDNMRDDDADGMVDCDDSDCVGNASCPEICDDGIDNDGDALTDCEDTADCPAGQGPCPGDDCPPFAFYFGDRVATAPVAVGNGDLLAISMRNAMEARGFTLGVKTSTAGALTAYEFSSQLGANGNELVDLEIMDAEGVARDPSTPNSATASRSPVDIVRGPAVEGFAAGDFFAADLSPASGGPGFTVRYVADADGNVDRIPPSQGEGCPVNEVVRIELSGEPERIFLRADLDGDGRITVTDAADIVRIALGILPDRFDCDDALDANDDGVVSVTDALPVLSWLFQRGEQLPDPFLSCGADATNDDLDCREDTPGCP